MVAAAVTTSEVNFLTGHALFSVADTPVLKTLWAVRVVTTVTGLMLLTSCIDLETVGLWLLVASAGLYFVADSIFKQRAAPDLIAEQFDTAQYSLINFTFDIPGLLVGSYDRFIVPLLNLFVALTLGVMFTVLKPLEEAWGCYQSDDLAHFEYGTCPEFTEVGVANVNVSGNICSRPESTINCVTRQSAFSDEITARHVAFVALALSVMFYAANLSNRMLFATKLLLAEQ